MPSYHTCFHNDGTRTIRAGTISYFSYPFCTFPNSNPKSCLESLTAAVTRTEGKQLP
ncbi:hypothetical protein Lalb_Chr10g0099201 [Lupinus albus]|uniref:Uncharacterized protein n=1 Tax=Lupinus albus TaxID=3870 RepID=A0A6A4PV71_LUPAL|nr:hypothetical protein Lalb_Chr10g0099201 [Lupinus albus]